MRLTLPTLAPALTLLLLTLVCTSVRAQCDAPLALIDLEANAVRARLTTNGSLWNGTYAVTNTEDSPGENQRNFATLSPNQ